MYWTKHEENDSDIPIGPFAAVDDLIYSFTGSVFFNKPLDIHILNTHTLIWSILPDRIDINGEQLNPPDVPIGREFHTVVAYDKKIYLWGGNNCHEEASNTLYCFDTETLNWSRPQVTGIIPSPRILHSACISNHVMYIFGGRELNKSQYTRDVHCLDLKTMNWGSIKTTDEKIPSLKAIPPTIVNNRIYIFGGHENEETAYFTDTMYLDLESNQWHHLKTTGKKPNFKKDHSTFVHNNIIYIFTGENYGELNDLYYFDTKRNHWNLIKPRGKSPKLREEQSCIIIRDKMFCLCMLGLDYKDGDEDYKGYRNTINVLDFNPSLKTLAIIRIIENGLDSSCLPKKLRYEIDSMRQDFAHI